MPAKQGSELDELAKALPVGDFRKKHHHSPRCEWVEGMGWGGTVGASGPSCRPSTPMPLGVSADPPAQTLLPKPPQPPRRTGLCLTCLGWGWGASSESLGSAGKLVLTHSGMPLAHSLKSFLTLPVGLVRWTHKGSFLYICLFPLLGCRVFLFFFSFRETGVFKFPQTTQQSIGCLIDAR